MGEGANHNIFAPNEDTKARKIYRGNCLVEIQRPPVIGIGIGPVRDAVPIGFIDKRIEA